MEINLDAGIITKLNDFCSSYGLTQEEAIRYMVGHFFVCNPTFFVSNPLPFVEPPQVDSLSMQTKLIARILASTQAVKCNSCTQHLNSEDIINGECSHCGFKI